jgi:hypothetical protein
LTAAFEVHRSTRAFKASFLALKEGLIIHISKRAREIKFIGASALPARRALCALRTYIYSLSVSVATHHMRRHRLLGRFVVFTAKFFLSGELWAI